MNGRCTHRLANGSSSFTPVHSRIRAIGPRDLHLAKGRGLTGGKHPNELPQFRWINTLLGNFKTIFSGTFHAFNFDKYARCYLGGYCFRFNRRFSMVAMTQRIANAVCCCRPAMEWDLRVAEAYG